MNLDPTCPECGVTLPTNSPEGLCPKCLVGMGLKLAPQDQGTVRIPPEPQTGDRIGHYKLLQQIGEGGCGLVYMAEQERPVRRRVALKIIKLGMDTKQVIARFDAERQALALMDHPNIAKVLDAGATETGRPFFVMELVRGIKITDYCDQNSLPTTERVNLFIQVCQAIQHAHQKGVIHRDLKPSNILVTLHDGVPVPKIIDFGIAKATTGQRLTDMTLFTAFEQFMGTPAYMSPEQAEMSGLDIDTRSDIYSLGVLLYELLTGETPFDAQALLAAGLDEMRRTIREKEPARPSTRLSTMAAADLTQVAKSRHTEPPRLIHLVRGDLDWIVMKCLEKDRTRRYETANGLAMDVKRYLSNEPVVARPPSKLYRIQKVVRRNKLAFAAVAAVGAALLLGVVVSSILLVKERKARQDAETARRKAERAEAAEKVLRRETEQASVNAYLAQSRAGRSSGRAGQRFESLEAITRAARIMPSLELRAEAIACLALPDLRPGKPLAAFDGSAKALAFDNGLERYARADTEGNISIRGVNNDRELVRLPGDGLPIEALRFGPGGQFLGAAVRRDRRLSARVWNLARRREVQSLPDLEPGAWDFSPDDRWLAIGKVEGSIDICDLTSGQVVALPPLGQRLTALCFGPGGAKLAVADETLTVNILDVPSGNVLQKLTHRGDVTGLAWHPDGGYLAVACSDLDIYVWDIEDPGSPYTVLKGSETAPKQIAFSHGGDLLASVGDDGPLRLWHPFTGRQLVEADGNFSAQGLQFSRDDLLLGPVTSGSEARFWEVAPGRECRTFQSHLAGGNAPDDLDISADGRLLASAGGDGVQFWDLIAGRKLGFLKLGATKAVRFYPDQGALVASDFYGLHRFPISPSLNGPATDFRVGPAHALGFSPPVGDVAFSADGRVMALVHRQHLDFPHWSSNSPSLKIRGQATFTTVAISPDGRWLATHEASPDQNRLWDTTKGAAIHTLALHGPAQFAFNPKGQTLVTGTDEEYCCWKTASWEPLWRYPRSGTAHQSSPAAFAPNGSLLAIAPSSTQVALVEPATGHTLAFLKAPGQKRVSRLCFSHDARFLVATTENHLIQVWDLPLIQHQIAAVQLNWDPAASVLPSPAALPAPLHLEVRLGNLEAPHEAALTLAQATQAVEANPADADAYHRRGHVYEGMQEYAQALSDFVRSLELEPDQADILRDKSHTLYHLNQLKEALTAVNEAIRLSPTNAAFIGFRGRVQLARKHFEEAATDLSVALAAAGTNSSQIYDRGGAYAEQGLWDKARSDFERALELGQASASAYWALGLVSLAQGDTNAYRRACAAIFDKFAYSSDSNDVALCARLCALVPGGFAEPGTLVSAAEKAVQAHAESLPMLFSLSLALCRDGRFEEAVERLGQIAPRYASDAAVSRAVVREVHIVLAIAHARLGHREQAAQMWQEAVRLEPQPTQQPGSPSPLPPTWAERQESAILAHEAEPFLIGLIGRAEK